MTPGMTPEQIEQTLNFLADRQRRVKRLLQFGATGVAMSACVVCINGYLALRPGSIWGRAFSLALCCLNVANITASVGNLRAMRRTLREMSEVRDVLELERLARL